ncbi:MAG: hypothetical protein K0U54_05820 [Bacteroidetes bacterium]|nr:hypothetical protein [Bacteroidota bacterium]
MKMFSIVLLAFVLLSCGSDDSGEMVQACTEEFVFGLQITVIDATTSQPVTSGLIVSATDGSYSEELELEDGVWLGAGERPGTYAINVASQQYTPATLTAVSVRMTSDDCHVITEQRELFVSPF